MRDAVVLADVSLRMSTHTARVGMSVREKKLRSDPVYFVKVVPSPSCWRGPSVLLVLRRVPWMVVASP